MIGHKIERTLENERTMSGWQARYLGYLMLLTTIERVIYSPSKETG